MFKLRRIHLRNWQRVKQATVEFPDYGLVYVAGVNNATKAGSADSIGSGKTSLGEAIFLPLFGVASKNHDPADSSTDDLGNTYVRVEGVWGNQVLKCELGYKAPVEFPSSSGVGLRWTIGGDVHERGHPRDTRAALSAFFGVSPLLAAWSLFIDGDLLRFNKLSGEDSVALFNEALRLPDWEECQERAKAAVVASRLTQERHTAALAEVKLRLPALEAAARDTSAVDECRAAVGREKEQLSAADEVVNTARAAVAAARTQLVADKDALSKIKRPVPTASRTELNEAEDAVAEWTHVLRTDKSTAQDAQDALDCATDTSAKPCPRCGVAGKTKTIDQGRVAACTLRLAEAKAALADSLSNLSEWTAVCKERERAFAEAKAEDSGALAKALGAQDEKVTKADNKVYAAEQECAAVTETRNRHRVALAEAEAELKHAHSVRATAKTSAQECSDRISELAAQSVEIEQTYKLAAYWQKAFGPAGIPTKIVSKVVGAMNQAAAGVGVSLGGDIVKLWFETSEGARPRIKAKFKSVHGAGILSRASKGEYGIANLAIAETIHSVAKPSAKIRWFDECLNSQDTTVRQLVYGYLREQARREQSLIFVVDHRPDTASMCDYTLTAEKSPEGWTSYHW